MMIVLLSIVLLLFLAACKDKDEAAAVDEPEEAEVEQEQDEPEESEPEPEVVEEDEFPYYYPLTGIGTEEEVNHRTFGIMIENSVSARPQTGLYQADIVYEVLTEATITRLLAFYHSMKPEQIGPVRSARDYYIHLNKGYEAIYASAGGSPDALAMIQNGEVDHISGLTYDGRFFTRSAERKAPHNMYTSYESLYKAAEQMGYTIESEPLEISFTEEIPSPTGKEAKHLEVKYGSASNNVQFVYDSEMKSYRRSNGGRATEDAVTGDPVAPKNIFIVEMSHEVIDNQGRRDIDVSSGGKAYLIQEGVLLEVDWESHEGLILPFKDGEQIPFLQGQTWINIIPSQNGGLDSHVEVFE